MEQFFDSMLGIFLGVLLVSLWFLFLQKIQDLKNKKSFRRSLDYLEATQKYFREGNKFTKKKEGK